MTLSGIGGIDGIQDWEETTSEYFEDVYCEEERPGGVYGVVVGVTATNVTPIGGSTSANRGRVRRQSEDAAVVVAYVQEAWYLVEDPDWAPNGDFALVP